jgi:tellurite resistance protein TerC
VTEVAAGASNLQVSLLGWTLFMVFVLAMLGLDLFINRHAHKPSLKEALIWSAFWILLAILFYIGLRIHPAAGPNVAAPFLTGYILEKALSVDNLFVFLVIFAHYKVPERYHHKVLFYGVLGAIVMRAIFVGLGAALVSRFSWVLYIFGAFLVYTGVKLLWKSDEEHDPSDTWVVRGISRILPVTKDYHDGNFFVRIQGKLWATPLLVVVLIVESTDVIFAVDSVPAVFAITRDPFIVYTSNIFAILGLRSLYFALEGIMHMFRFLKVGLSIILVLIGLKLIFIHWVEKKFGVGNLNTMVLGVVGIILLVSIAASLAYPVKSHAKVGEGKRKGERRKGERRRKERRR